MPAVPSCILNPLREQFLALVPTPVASHPLGCHRPRIDVEIVFDKIVEALVYGAGYERIADARCSASTLRRRRAEWARAGLFADLRTAVLDWGHLPPAGDYEHVVGLDLDDVAVDGCNTKAPCGGEIAGKSPVDRAKQGTKRSQLVDGAGIPIAAVPAPANTPDHRLLTASLDALKDVQPLPAGATVHLDAGYDYAPCRAELEDRGLVAQIARRGLPAPVQIGRRWVVERTNSWMNDFGKLRRCTERRGVYVQGYLDLAAAIVTLRALLRAAWYTHRWDNRPGSPRIR